jgi:hypothetical protein
MIKMSFIIIQMIIKNIIDIKNLVNRWIIFMFKIYYKKIKKKS